jgi:RHS repeat-associated protein
MPIDIGGGVFHEELQEISIPGKYELAWTRNYTTALLRSIPTPLGRGWTNPYFCGLTRQGTTYHFSGPQGSDDAFPDPDGRLQRGERVINLGAFLDLQRRDDGYVVRNWDVQRGEVTHYVFGLGQSRLGYVLRAIELPTGHGLDLEYGGRDRLVAIAQRVSGRRLVLNYDRNGWIEAVRFQPPSGEPRDQVRYRHDEAGALTAAADVAGLEDRYEYDADGRMTREVLKDGGVFTMRYDQQGRCVYRAGLDRYDEKRLRFFDAANLVEVTDSLGAVWSYHRLPSGQITEEVNPLGGVKRTAYDEHARIATVTDETGATTTFTYDADGNRASITNPEGHRYTLRYHDARLPVTLVDPVGGVWERRYDAEQRIVRTQDPAGGVWAYAYDGAGNMVEVVNPVSARRSLAFEGGMLVQGTDWMGNASRYGFDDLGRLTERTDPLGHVTRIVYDRWGNIAAHHSPDGSERRMEYDAVGNLTRYIDANGEVTSLVYGPCALLQKVTAPDGTSSEFFWSTEPDQLIAIVNEQGDTYRFVRDAAGNILEEIGFDGRRLRYEYDQAGRPIAIVNGDGEEQRLERDGLGRIVRRALPDGQVTSFGFDPLGDLAAAANDAIELKFERDAVGRLLREVQGDHWVSSAYDLAGHLVRTATDLGLVVEYEVDPNGETRRATVGVGVITFARDARGLETSRGLLGQTRLETRHDPVGKLTSQAVGPRAAGQVASSVTSFGRTYDYTSHGMLETSSDSQWGGERFRYDRQDRLVEVASTAERLEWFDYSRTGDLVTIGSRRGPPVAAQLEYAPGNRLLRAGETEYRHDLQGRLVAKGPVSTRGFTADWTYRWNAADELVEVTGADRVSWSYAYDPLGRRISKSSDGARRTAFVWDRDRLIHEIHAGGVVGWVFERENLAPLARVDDQGPWAAVCDWLGTPIAFASLEGELRRAPRLTAFGSVEASELPAGWCNLRFQGQYFDAESGLHYSRFRYYAPDVGRFISQDPTTLHGGFNFYRYVINPVNFIDPYGLSTSSDSQMLGNNLVSDGQSPIGGGNEDAHHIVMSNSSDPRMQDLRGVLAGHGVDINDPRNGIWLPRTAADRAAGDDRTLHKGEGLHSDAYKQHVYDKLMAGAPPPPTKQALLARLRQLKKDLAQGKTFPCKR